MYTRTQIIYIYICMYVVRGYTYCLGPIFSEQPQANLLAPPRQRTVYSKAYSSFQNLKDLLVAMDRLLSTQETMPDQENYFPHFQVKTSASKRRSNYPSSASKRQALASVTNCAPSRKFSHQLHEEREETQKHQVRNAYAHRYVYVCCASNEKIFYSPA